MRVTGEDPSWISRPCVRSCDSPVRRRRHSGASILFSASDATHSLTEHLLVLMSSVASLPMHDSCSTLASLISATLSVFDQ